MKRPACRIAGADCVPSGARAGVVVWGLVRSDLSSNRRVLDLTATGAMAWPGFEIVCGQRPTIIP